MSESRILLIDSDAVRAERTVSLLEFMDFNPRWVTDGADINPGRHRHDEWMAVMVGSAQDAAQADKFFDWLADAKLPPPVLLMEGSPSAFAQAHGLHEANVWALDTPCGMRSWRRCCAVPASNAWTPNTRPACSKTSARPATARRSPACAA